MTQHLSFHSIYTYIYIHIHSHIPLLQPGSASYQKWQDTGEHETSFMRRIKQVSAPKPASGWIISHKNPRAWIYHGEEWHGRRRPWMERRTRVSVYGGGEGRGNYAGNDGKYKPGEFHQGMYPGFSRVEREYKYGESALLSSRRTIVVLVSFPTEC